MTTTADAPPTGEALLPRAMDAHMAGRLPEAVALYRSLLATTPFVPEIWNNLAFALADLGRKDEAAAAFHAAITVKPGYARPLIGLGNLHNAGTRPDKAILHWSRALSLEPGQGALIFNLGIALQEQGAAPEAAERFQQAAEALPGDPRLVSQLLLCLNYLDRPGEQLLDDHRRFDALHGRLDQPDPPPHANPPDPERKLRIGYLSVEFRAHLGGYFLAPLFDGHDRSAFEIHSYSILPEKAADGLTASFKEKSDGWRTVDSLGDEALAARIRADGIDILVDLAGHSGLNRLPALARRPAPVQMTWLGYPNTTGMRSMDHRLVDGITDPPGVAEGHASERLLRLPAPFLCFRPPADAPAVIPLPAGTAGVVTFGSFNKLAKLSDSTVRLWAAILRRAPGARLLLKDRSLDNPGTADAIRDRFRRAGADPDRLILLGWVEDPAGHLGLYNRIDIALDPTPYNGTITTCDALWMGAPMVTLLGDRHAARVGASLLSAVGLSELIAATPERYVDIAVSLAWDLNRLMWLRKGMRERLLGSPLCDEARFVRALESAYRQGWRDWCARQDGGGPDRP
ncbi:tetratricopeptide repeat protein [Azospirillum doebereinerae]|uniref:protein O-GlcNAc transferase n=1 Tax=Azospirillum doebereinerae TaxID=92933 RepID=A0A3S0V5E7_9PROT|nr:tetratricopeptide repeat protein [Azospirillum doebereinerae]MCG5238928.1 tetratricopeptide repeat protein [Azospirillum doebereinerae]RUQ68946.1 tetratricopeptide repeat protein [Azospirillum doebereinerae]